MTKGDGRKGILLLGSQIRVGGAQKALLTLARYLFEKGIPVTVAFLYDKDNLLAVWQSETPFPLFSLGAWKDNGGAANGIRIVMGMFNLCRLVFKSRPIGMISYTEHANIPAMLAGSLGRVPVRIVTMRGRIQAYKKWQAWLHAVMFNLGMGTLMVANSESGQRISIKEGIPSGKTMVIPNGIEIHRRDPDIRRRVRKELGLLDDDLVVFSAGRMAYEKGHDLLIEAAPGVIYQCPNVVFMAAGDGEMRPQYEAMVSRLGLEGHFRFLGNRKDIFDLLSAADIYTLPSRSEGMPNALLEAMSMGVPAAAFRTGGVIEVITNGQNGLLAEPDNTTDLSEIITRLAEDPELRRILGEAGQKHVVKEYGLEEVLNRYVTLFTAL